MYKKWDDSLFHAYITKFQLPLKKKLKAFSKGMLMKASLVMALSHQAELIIMDEPTAGLDPVFRREFLSLLHELVQDGEKTIFFSTHITSDLDRIADYILFLHDGQLKFSDELLAIEEKFVLVKGGLDLLDPDTEKEFIAIHKTKFGFEGLSNNKEQVMKLFGELAIYESATLEDIMFYTKKGCEQFVAFN